MTSTHLAPKPATAAPKKEPRNHAPEDIQRLSRLIAITVMNSPLRNQLNDRDRDWADDVVAGYKEEAEAKEAEEAEALAKKQEAEDAALAKKQADEAAEAAKAPAPAKK